MGKITPRAAIFLLIFCISGFGLYYTEHQKSAMLQEEKAAIQRELVKDQSREAIEKELAAFIKDFLSYDETVTVQDRWAKLENRSNKETAESYFGENVLNASLGDDPPLKAKNLVNEVSVYSQKGEADFIESLVSVKSTLLIGEHQESTEEIYHIEYSIANEQIQSFALVGFYN